MRIEVLFFAEFKEIFGPSRLVEAAEGTSIEKIVDLIAEESREFFLKKSFFLYAVNENFEDGETVLKDKDKLAIMTPMAGGS